MLAKYLDQKGVDWKPHHWAVYMVSLGIHRRFLQPFRHYHYDILSAPLGVMRTAHI